MLKLKAIWYACFSFFTGEEMVKASKNKLKFLAVIIFITIFFVVDPLKVTNPSNPYFDPDRFSFADYKGRSEKIEVFIKLFPVGTPKTFVDRVLVKAGKANPDQNRTFPKLWHYWEPQHFDTTIQHQFIFDDQLKLMNIRPYAGTEVYTNQTTKDDLINEYKARNGIKN